MLYAKVSMKYYEGAHKEYEPVTIVRKFWGHRMQDCVRFPDGTIYNKSNVEIKEARTVH